MVSSPSRGTVTMSEVAAAAGVSLGTVSNVLNHPERVRDEVIERVSETITRLGYVRNSAARTLAAGRSNTVGYVMVDISNSLYTDIARGAEDVTSSSGMYLVVANAGVEGGTARQATYTDHFVENQLQGILLAVFDNDVSGVARIRQSGGRVVLLDVATDLDVDACTVRIDYELSGYLAASHLLDLGRTRLAFVGGLRSIHAIGERLAGAERAVAEHGAATIEFVTSNDIQASDGRELASALAVRAPGEMPDGIITAADLVATGLMPGLLARGLRIPDDVALIACDDNKSGYDNVVPLSTIDLPGYAVGQAGMNLLLDEIRDADHVHRRVVLKPTLSARESSVGRSR